MRTSNPAFSPRAFRTAVAVPGLETMTVRGTVNKAILLFLLVLLSAGWIWKRLFTSGSPDSYLSLMYLGALGGFIVALATIFRPQWARVTAPLYALLEGLFLGGFSALLEARYPGIVLQAVLLTFGTMIVMLTLYRSGVVRATPGLVRGVIAATGGVMVVYLLDFFLGFFHTNLPLIHQGGVLGIGFGLLVTGIAAFNLILDFAFIEESAARGAPGQMEWYGAFGLMVTLVWLYLEIIRLLARFNSRD